MDVPPCKENMSSKKEPIINPLLIADTNTEIMQTVIEDGMKMTSNPETQFSVICSSQTTADTQRTTSQSSACEITEEFGGGTHLQIKCSGTLPITEMNAAELPKSDFHIGASQDTNSGSTTCAMVLNTAKSETGDIASSACTGDERRGRFSIDRSMIDAIPMEKQVTELQGLGVNVYSQEDFEAGVMAQLDQAAEEQDRERIVKMLTRECKTVAAEIKSVNEEVSHLTKLLSAQTAQLQSGGREVQRRLDSMRNQKENKLKQLKKLKARHRALSRKLDGNTDGADDGDESNESLACILGIETNKKETDAERLIRTGEITPFGTTAMGGKVDISSPRSIEKLTNQGNQSKPVGKPSTSTQLSDFELYLLDQARLTTSSNKKRKREVTNKRNSAETRSSLNAEDSAFVHRRKLIEKSSSASAKVSTSVRSSGASLLSGNILGKRGLSKDREDSDSSLSAHEPEINSDLVNAVHNDMQNRLGSIHERKRKYPGVKHGHGGEFEEYGSDKEWKPDSQDLNLYDPEEFYHPEGEFSSDEETSLRKKSALMKKKKSLKKTKKVNLATDDGSERQYINRLRQYRKEQLEQKQERIEMGNHDEDEPEEFEGGLIVPGRLWSRLYRYQKTGVRWMWELHQQRTGGIVGDEMGLGKTIQAIVFLAALKESKLRSPGTKYIGLGPSIIVTPTTVMHQWVMEFHIWWAPFRIAVFHDTGNFVGSKASLVQDIQRDKGVLITSYAGVVQHQKMLVKYDWHYVILDEGHKIRNPDAQATLAVKQFRTPHRLILSGSPVQNNLKELWSLFDFVFPGKLGTLPVFMQQFSVPITQGGYSNATCVQVTTAYRCACALRDTISPYLLRRMKADVRDTLSLPDKNDQVLFCRLTEEQKGAYREYLSSDQCQMILGGNYKIFVGLITLRKICNHPDIATGGPRVFDDAQEEALPDDLKYGFYRRSGKMIVVESLLELWKRQGHRVLLFSQSTQMLDILETFVRSRGYEYVRMDGKTTISTRQPLIARFNADPSIFVFLLTTKVGGLGVNLIGANRVIIYDPDWNPSTDTQARERAWRIGQTRNVTIYRLLTAGTIEEKIYHRQIFKQFLTNRVLKDPKQRRFFKTNDIFELFTLKDDSDRTETSAIFAGTQSEITLQRQSSREQKVAPSGSKKWRHKKHARHSVGTLRSKRVGSERPSSVRRESRSTTRVESGGMAVSSSCTAKRDAVTMTPLHQDQVSGTVDGCASDGEEAATGSVGQSSTGGVTDPEVINAEKTVIEITDNRPAGVDRVGPTIKTCDGKIATDPPCLSSPQGGGHILDSHCMKATLENAECEVKLQLDQLSTKVEEKDTNDRGDGYVSGSDSQTIYDAEITAVDRVAIQPQSEDKEQICDSETITDGTEALSDSTAYHVAAIGIPDNTTTVISGTEYTMSTADDTCCLSGVPNSAVDGAAEACASAGEISSEPIDSNRSGDISTAEPAGLAKLARMRELAHKLSEQIANGMLARPTKHASKKSKRPKEKRKKRAKKSHEDADVDGVKISFLEKKCLENNNAADDHAQQDDYVLRKLFKKTGVHSALKHDNIMDSSTPDYLLVEAEADKVAKQAVSALKQSRRQCLGAVSGVPTWTGQSGTSGAPPGIAGRPRFGQKKNTRIVQPAATATSEKPKEETKSEKHPTLFTGEELVSAQAAGAMTSQQLLSRIRNRNHGSGEGDELSLTMETPSLAQTELLTDLRNFVAFQAATDGAARTEELLAKFNAEEKINNVVFRSLLKQICDFHRTPSGGGIWKLKPEFR
ncbi:PREDICTED: DNA excision repair protein ERCC-6-like [Priapulus caudatus]|uniref:DNA repair and recombination protein RAD54-like n=1 Tax=Priapulus caudatus TaxID=37621 RepID=A0ABM1E2Q1_PRICU|nr:PREDICTED: DNA excision repair protein ERCC-6-like [Priapulus caudatus]XP_014666473.1 PREDICTED: DNA excision repair protein ERCC-6-like [Priapulus caudatus]XP_014666474.1 PREDICTED: DNA excision repair protein ERCC-6-like [Priapulus caudatus]